VRYFEGIFPAILTPFDGDGRFLAPAYERFIAHLYTQGVSGVFACGVVGEGLLMNTEEREAVAETAVRASRGKGAVLVQVGSATTAESTRLARHAVQVGADGVSCLAPHSGGFGLEPLLQHFRAVVQAASPLPFLIYYNPGLAPCLTDYSLLERLLDLPGVNGVKFSGLNAEDLSYCVTERSGRQNVLTGVDEMLLATQMLGAHGAIAALANILPADFVAIRRAVTTGQCCDAIPHQLRLIRAARILYNYPFFSALKAIASRCGVDLGTVRLPHLPLSGEQRAELLRLFEEAGM
jgi:N-acetylneuraminate lyase